MNNKIKLLSILVTFSLLLSACSALAPATPNPQDQQATVEAAVAQTLQAVSAALTSTAAVMPTATFTVAATATQAPTKHPAAFANRHCLRSPHSHPGHRSAHSQTQPDPHPQRLCLQIAQHLPGGRHQDQHQHRF
jgi:hypothetical protein